MRKIYEDSKQTLKTSAMFSVVVFAILLLVVALILLVIFILMHNGILMQGYEHFDTKAFVIGMAVCSILLGAALTPIAARIPMRPVNTLLHAMEKLANGDYKTRLDYEGIMGRNLAAVRAYSAGTRGERVRTLQRLLPQRPCRGLRLCRYRDLPCI